ncbi:hypothetical protein CDV31_002984 [Fusarium ambrosium]|uniref:PNPLA domain-containing protein n=1 Tax=Fusarium ambrosium TaxID=131363 RepID=A0A428UVD2_9HYPO|nr:hypothetical protein CDV31_002984 [Fusarium ambrosium]
MEQAAMVVGPGPLDESGLCMLSFDGGGVRGLSSLYILDHIMRNLNHQRALAGQPTKKPCEIFDLIGGTSTGGLIAIMLGRLEMDVGECIAAYCKLFESVFKVKKHWSRVTARGKIQPRFDSKKLKAAIETVLKDRNISPTTPFNDRVNRGCKVFVCATSTHSMTTRRLRSYDTIKEPHSDATIVQVAMATSAASTFFEPVTIGDMTYIDGGLGANNPVDEVVGEARYILGHEADELKPLVKCFISIGTGNPGIKSISDNFLQFISTTLVSLSTNTEATAKRFALAWRDPSQAHRYFRFNVEQGLQDIDLSEYKESGKIKTVTQEYLEHADREDLVEQCVKNLKTKQKRTNRDLVEKIQAYNNTVKSAANDPPSSPKYCLPFAKNQRFIGREAILKKLSNALFGEEPYERIALTGLGGVGKTQTALQFAFWVQHEKPEYSIFWLSALSASSFEQSCNTVATELNIFQQGLDSKAILRDFLSSKKSGPWLIIVDNVDEMDLVRVEGEHSFSIDEQLPQSPAGRILFTTRSNEVALVVSDEEPLELGEMEPEEALKFLGKSITSKPLLADHSLVSELLKELTYLPLAIAQAAAYLNRNKITITRYLELLRGTEQEMISLLSREFPDRTRYSGSKNAVATTWLVSFDQILAHDPMAAKILRFISRIEPKDIPLSILPRGELEEELTYSVGTLCAYMFLVPREGQEVYDMHSLVHLATRIWVQRTSLASETTMDAYKHLAAAFDTAKAQRPYWRQYISHALKILRSEHEIEIKERFTLSHKVGHYLRDDGRMREAGECYRESSSWAREHLPEGDLDRLHFEISLSVALHESGKVEKSIALLQQVATTCERSTSLAEPRLRALGFLYSFASKGNPELASQALKRAYHAMGELPKDNPNRQRCWASLAVSFLTNPSPEAFDFICNTVGAGDEKSRWHRWLRQYHSGRTSEYREILGAIKGLQYEVGILQSTASLDDGVLRFKQGALATKHATFRRLHKSVERSQFLLATIERTEEFDSLTVESGVFELMLAHLMDQKPGERVRNLEHLNAMLEENHPPEYACRLGTQNLLGSTYLDTEQPAQAARLLRRTVKEWKTVGALDDNPQLLEVELNLGVAYYELGYLHRAAKLLEHVAEIRRKTLPEDNLRRAKTEKFLEIIQKGVEEVEKLGDR